MAQNPKPPLISVFHRHRGFLLRFEELAQSLSDHQSNLAFDQVFPLVVCNLCR